MGNYEYLVMLHLGGGWQASNALVILHEEMDKQRGS